MAPGGGAVGDLHPWRFRDTDRTMQTPCGAVPWFPLAAIGSVGTTTTGVARRATEGVEDVDVDEDEDVDVDVDTSETTIQCDSVRRKRKKKMNKHKHSKRRRLNKHKKR